MMMHVRVGSADAKHKQEQRLAACFYSEKNAKSENVFKNHTCKTNGSKKRKPDVLVSCVPAASRAYFL
jgi:hypothetical protein